MRRLMILAAGLLLAHTGSGCKHVAGYCDCAPLDCQCTARVYGMCPDCWNGGVAPVSAAGVPAPVAGPIPAPAAVTPLPITIPAQPPAGELPTPAPVTEKIGPPKGL